MLSAGGRHPGSIPDPLTSRVPLYAYIARTGTHHEPKKVVTDGNLGENNSWTYVGGCSESGYLGSGLV